MSRVVIGMDPHKRSATIEAIDEREKALAQGRFSTDTEGYQQMLARELIEELTLIDAKIRAADKQLRQLVTEHGSSLTELYGIAPVRRSPADRRHR